MNLDSQYEFLKFLKRCFQSMFESLSNGQKSVDSTLMVYLQVDILRLKIIFVSSNALIVHCRSSYFIDDFGMHAF